MKLYIINKKNKENQSYKQIVIINTNQLTGEATFWKGNLQELDEKPDWGQYGDKVEAVAILERERVKRKK